MDRRRLLPLLLTVLLVGGCAEVRGTATTVRDCAGLASDVARTGLAGVPTQAEAEAAAQRLDQRVQDLADETIRSAATRLRDRLRDLKEAAASADPARARAAADDARDAAREAASACGLPADQFLGQ